jgi:hypothetical protein
MFSNTSRNRLVWAHSTLYGLLATAVKLYLDPLREPSPVVAGIAAFFISAAAHRLCFAAGKGRVTMWWGAGIGAATGLLTSLLMYLLLGIFLGLATGRLLEMLGWSVAYAYVMLAQVGVYITAGGAVVGALLFYVESTLARPVC